MHRVKRISLLILLLSVCLIGLFLQEGWTASEATKQECSTCHADFKPVLPGKHPPVSGKDITACIICHKPAAAEKAAPNRLSARLHRAHAGAKAKIDCLTCHTWTLDRGFGLAGQKEPWGPLSEEDLASLKKVTESWVGSTYLDALHSDKNITCTGCHAKRLPAKDATVETDRCLKCHGSYEKLAKQTVSAKYPGRNPHKSHQGELECAKCHLGHRESKSNCLECHADFSPAIPGGAVGSSKPKKAPAAASKVTAGPSRPAAPTPVSSDAGQQCGTCHSGPQFQKQFSRTAHGKLDCASCHKGIKDIGKHMQKSQKPEPVSCAACHREIESRYSKSHHALEAKITCLQCHTDIHPQKAPSVKKGKADSVQICLKCHSDQEKYLTKGHTAKALAGNPDAAVCRDCHGSHTTPVFAATDKGVMEKRVYYTQLCITCHREGGVAGRYGAFDMAVKAYGETYHGKVRELGHYEKVAGCADCHAGHNILPAEDPASALNPGQLMKTCGKCHQGFHPRFVSYVPHPNPDSPKGFLSLYLTEKAMIALLAGVFGFFWIHILLWWRKAFAEQRSLAKEGVNFSADLPEEVGNQYVRRFTTGDRIMHIVLILSFFGVVITGFPLKYPATSWAKAFIALFGGVESAGAIHRISAAFMWLLFLYTCWLSFKFLFPGFRFKGWVGRLLGPDSLFPRIKDLQDCWGMFKWFFNAGERPQFDRWTYWEKFDFMAVFWGMFVIGTSGIVMWIPEWSSYLMPGWMINIVHLAHSEEALLAAVFIFTVHFFNNHLVPDKFPQEKNIFTGCYTLNALKRERPLEYERILAEQRLDGIKCKGPGLGIKLFAWVFGIASVLLGLALTALIFWAVVMT